MHVVHVYDGHEQVYDGRGSVPNVVWHIADETVKQGHEVTILERQWAGLPNRDTHEGVDFIRFSLRTGSAEPWEEVPYELVESRAGVARLVVDRTNFAIAALRHLRRLDWDVIQVHLPFAASVLVTIAPWLRKRTVYTAHLGELRMNALTDEQRSPDGTTADQIDEADHVEGDDRSRMAGEQGEDSLEVPGVLRYLSPDLFLAKRIAHTTVLNGNIASVFRDGGVPADRVSVVPNGVDFERFGDISTDHLDRVRDAYTDGDGPVLLFVGTVMPRKGVDDLVKAAAALVEEHGFEDLEVIVAGEDDLDGAYTNRVRELADDLGIEHVVRFPGFVPDDALPGLYALADVFVLPSREEGFGMTVLEAMAAGTPVVATDVGGVADLVSDDAQGYLVSPNDIDDIVLCVKEILSANPQRGEFEDAARRRAREYTWPAIVPRYISIYQEVAGAE